MKLKKCPFCGSEAKEDRWKSRSYGYHDGNIRIICTNEKCLCQTYHYHGQDDRDLAIQQWNNRV